MVFRIFGYLLCFVAVALGIIDVVQYYDTGKFAPITAGEVWRSWDIQSLAITQSGIERHVATWLWDPVIVSVLRAPLWAVLAIPGILLILLFRPKTTR